MCAILLCVSLIIAPQEPIKQHSPTRYKQNQSSKAPPAVPANAPSEQSAPAPKTEQQQSKVANKIERIEIVPQPPDWWFKGYVIFTGVIAGINLFMLIAMWRQRKIMAGQLDEMKDAGKKTDTLLITAQESARAAKKSADTAEKALELSERADIFLDGISFSDPTTGHITPHTRPIFFFKNSGRTRAQNVRFEFYMSVPDTPHSPHPEMPPVTIGAGGEQRLAFSTPIECFTEPTYRRILDGTVPLRFDGKVFYEDIFGKQHWARYSGIYDHRSRNFHIEKNETD